MLLICTFPSVFFSDFNPDVMVINATAYAVTSYAAPIDCCYIEKESLQL